MTKIIDGKKIAQNLRKNLTKEIESLKIKLQSPISIKINPRLSSIDKIIWKGINLPIEP